MIEPTPPLDENIAIRIFQSHFTDKVSSVIRFPTGLCHHVFEILTTNNKSFVVRIASPDSQVYLEGGLHWHPHLKTLGIPVPMLYASCLSAPYPYMLLERLPGSDLGQVYSGLTSSAKKNLAVALTGIQSLVSTLPTIRKFGFAFSDKQTHTTNTKSSWTEVVAADISRGEERIRKVGRIDCALSERVRSVLRDHETYLNGVKPVPFLDDITTKNVIINQGTLSGIVDTDEICFGDPFFTLGLTKMSLLSMKVDTDYIEYWLDAMQANRQQRVIVEFYTLVFCLGFMGELGQVFNKHIEFNYQEAEKLRFIFEQLISSIGSAENVG
jgi:aminoglycoside phosphotransferase (APT) family kinase protein